MKLVLDSNIIFSALIRKSTTRNIILSDVFYLHAPEYIFAEITKHKVLLLRKSKMTDGADYGNINEWFWRSQEQVCG